MSPSDMIEDRVRAIEATMDEMKSQHEATHQLLQDVLARLGPTQAQNVQDRSPSDTSRLRVPYTIYTRLFRRPEEARP